MPAIGFGTWQLQDEAATDAVTAALEAGYRLIDASGNYGNLASVGRALGGADGAGGQGNHGVARDDIFLTTKIEFDEDPVTSLKAQLEQLGLERADLTLIHWPPPEGDGIELWKLLIEAREQGLTTDIGVSNYDAKLIDELVAGTGEVPAVNQIEWSPFGHGMDFRKYLRSQGVAIQAYSPLAQFKKLDHPVLREIGEAHGDADGSGSGRPGSGGRPKTPGQVVLRWDVQLGVVPLPRSGTPAHIAENFDVFDFELSDDEMARVSGLNEEFSAIAGLNYL